ncbi:hypothetical protein EWH23_03030 [Meiothermus sp. PNK-Is4]|uniref:Uncharacterized protein n=1 Tax=Allomeiothermus silvanus (strain ATCC 700542 / DSM 9946 / NBRC 106475 / NCIMB 13440 / VI-R2) TaxID=526227 RepID=D7BA10_ALLS1|nr:MULTISPECIES: hypothetical protein [Thermaceae]ADH62444.1 hypothetical protein Mesil_0511 [Allomeiothermus silvanus DSM 9946]RYM39480.1 hypothetical protein EWH23_03030 [Meiothermus sp. PNK-Is4]
MERAIRVIGWAGVIVGLSGVLPGIFLLRGSMIEFGMLVLLLSALVLLGLGALEELRHIRRGIARLAVRAEQVASPSGEHSVASPSGEHSEEQRAE